MSLLAGSGGPAKARFGAPHLFLWPGLVLCLSAGPRPGWRCGACGCSCVLFFLCAPAVSGVPGSPALGALGLGVLWSPPPSLVFFCFLSTPSAPLFVFFSFIFLPCFCFSSLFGLFFFPPVFFLSVPRCAVCSVLGSFVCPGLWSVLVCVVVGVVVRRGPVCACAVSFGAPCLCLLSVCCCLLCSVCPLPLCWRRCFSLCCLWCQPCVICPLVLFCGGACGLWLPLGHVWGLS